MRTGGEASDSTLVTVSVTSFYRSSYLSASIDKVVGKILLFRVRICTKGFVDSIGASCLGARAVGDPIFIGLACGVGLAMDSERRGNLKL